MFLKLSVLCLLVQAISGQTVDYCDKTLCITGTHIGCNNTGVRKASFAIK